MCNQSVNFFYLPIGLYQRSN